MLATVRAVVDDFPALQGGLDRLVEIVGAGSARRLAAEQDPDEVGGVPATGSASDHFVFLGFHEDVRDADGRLAPAPGTGLGLLRDTREAGELRVPAHDPPAPAGTRATPRSWRSPRPTRCRPCTGASR